MLQTLRKLIRNDSPLRLGYHALMGWSAALLYGFPARKMTCIGITGTDGKTTTTFLTTDLLRGEGIAVGMASTVGICIRDTYMPNKTHKTTMGRLGLQRLLRDMVKAGCTHAVLEVSSHGLMQSRLAGIPFSVAVITNLSREHLDYHRTMENYKRAKGKLFQIMSKQQKGSRTAVIGADFAEAPYYASFPADTQMFFGFEGGKARSMGNFLTATMKKVHEGGQDFRIQTQDQEFATSTTLAGDFNVLNILAALGAAQSVVPLERLVAHIPTLQGVPGRMEEIRAQDGRRVFIDYAVTPEALTKLYSTLRTMTTGKVIAVLGACGDRDKGKRPEMGAIASKLCDMLFITDEEPYTEDPSSIMAMLEQGAKQTEKGNYTVIPARGEAIREACALAKPGDIVVVSGMGDQTSRVVGETMIPWSDREEIRKVLSNC